jgi:cell division protein FtsW
MRVSRADRSRFTDWWFTVDHVLLTAIFILIGAGLVLSLAASPPVAIKKGLPPFYFVERHMFFSAIGAVILITVSFLSPKLIRRTALAVLAGSFAALVVVHLFGAELNGARRWLSIAGHSLQPSEFAKPAFVVVSAWLLAEARTRPEMPAISIAVLLFIGLGALLVLQPDVGQTLLISAVWGAMFFVSGQPLSYAALGLGLGAAGLGLAYFNFPHVQVRVDKFLSPLPGDNSQVDRALQSFTQGGFFGRGPGEGTIKTSLPDAHTDFIFAVVAEEYGAVACLVLLLLFGFIVMRALYRSGRETEPATRLAVIGLALVFGLQALINMGVNTGLLPAKGMTLPYLSAGGSSMLAVSLTLGMLLALTRRRAGLPGAKRP